MYFQGIIWRKVNQQIIKILNTLPNIEGSRVVVALSGGMDSVFLLAALMQIQKKYKFTLLPVYIDHKIQPEANLFRKIAEYVSLNMDLPYSVFAIKKCPKGRNLEDWMRDERYRLLESFRKKQKANFVAVAHHASDQAETVLAHVIRGTGLKGLEGMQPVRGTIIRPLLNCAKKDIESLMRTSKIPYYEDKLNYSKQYQRNKIRHDLIPYLEKEFNPKITARLTKLAEVAQKSQIPNPNVK